MVNNRMNDGVGKKIVEALKKQSDVEITPMSEEVAEDVACESQGSQEEMLPDGGDLGRVVDENVGVREEAPLYSQPAMFRQPAMSQASPMFEETHATMEYSTPTMNINPAVQNTAQNFAKDLDDFEVPSNVAVLRQLITQLPNGVTKQTGAQIIRQTMEALGISMKSVLQEAQQVQETLNSSARECQANIMENKRQIVLLENQVQKYTRQSAALNDIISLFVQTGH